MNTLFLIWFAVLFSFCTENKVKNNNDTKKSILNYYNFDKPNQIEITSKLNEISGLTLSSKGNIFAVNDEIGIIFELNPNNGKIIKSFSLNNLAIKGDFEGITVTKQNIYVITSNGNLYKFNEGENYSAVKFNVIKLPFSNKFEIEGLFYDEELNGLLILPKEYSGKKYKNSRTVYLYSFENLKVMKTPVFIISLKELKENFGIKDFYPSGITKHPLNGHYLIISAKKENSIVELSKSGKIISAFKLKEKIHRQPEGITILKDYSLLISDEAAGKKPTLTKYEITKMDTQ
ncbi:MAG: hypothetical protein CR986_07135 [Ignavibacteriae bacterium]|nr:MAG: hypothetical protein CR986_07135 [Ignavibacteriota bacterium]